MTFKASRIYLRIVTTCFAIIFLSPSQHSLVVAKPQMKQNQNWILPPSREESENGNAPKLPQIVDLLTKWWPFSSDKTFIPAINPNELLKRVGIVSNGNEGESNWIITGEKENENILGNNEKIGSNEKDESLKFNIPLDSSNSIEEWSDIIPTKIKKSIDSMTSELINATERVKYHLDKARNSLISNVKEVLNLPTTDTKLPKESANVNGVYFLEENIIQPVSKFVDSLGIEEKLSSFYSKFFDDDKFARRKWVTK